MKRWLLGMGVVVLCTATVSHASYFRSARGSFSTMWSQLTYDPSKGCHKPTRPYSMNSQWERDAYVRDGERYLSCLREATEDDLKYAGAKIQEGYEKAQSDFLDEVRTGY